MIKEITITDNIAKIVKTAFYCDINYVGREDGRTYGDMGFAFCDQVESRNEDSAESNIKGLKDWARDYIDGGEVEEDIPVMEILEGEFIYNEEYYHDEERSDIENDLKSTSLDMYDLNQEVEPRCVYRIALCSEEDAKVLNLESIVGKVDLYMPTDSVED